MSSTIGVAFIGCGGITSAHLNGLKILQQHGLDDVEVRVLCSRRTENARRYNDRNDAPAPLPPIVPGAADPLNIRNVYVTDLAPGKPARIMRDWHDAVAAPDVDAVIILAPVDAHHEIGLAALSAGKHVFVEKPMAITVRACRLLCEMAEEKDLALGVAESARYSIETRAIRWALDNDYIGNPRMVVHASIGSVWSPDRIVGKTAWRHERSRAGAGILMDVGVHLFNRVRYLFGDPLMVSGLTSVVEPMRTTRDRRGEIIETVTCDVEDTAFANMTFARDAIGSFSLSWAGRGSSAALSCDTAIYGDLGCIKEGQILSDHHGTLPLVSSFVDDVTPDDHQARFPSGVENPFALEQHAFFQAIRSGEPMETDGREGLKDVAASYAVIESAFRGESTDFRDVEDCVVEGYQRKINDDLDIS